MNGGLGNQTFQYIFTRYLEESMKTRVFVDDSFFFLEKQHNGLELNYVFPNAPKPLLLSEYFEPDVWRYMIERAKIMEGGRIRIAQLLYDNGINFVMMVEVGRPEIETFTGPKIDFLSSDYNERIAGVTGDIYFFGHWLDQRWFNAYKDTFLREFSLRPLEGPQNLVYESAVRESFSVGVHIRRGDFVTLGWAIPETYYYTAVNELSSQHPDAVFFIFSDDIPWCKKNERALGLSGEKTVYVEGNFDYKNNYADLYLMTLCNVLIGWRSSFSFLAKVLNQQPGFYSI
jgi:hypothetical protein